MAQLLDQLPKMSHFWAIYMTIAARCLRLYDCGEGGDWIIQVRKPKDIIIWH